jgi:hypothetical protein
MGLRQKLSSSFGLRPDADKIATSESNGPELKFPTTHDCAIGVFTSPVRRQLRANDLANDLARYSLR